MDRNLDQRAPIGQRLGWDTRPRRDLEPGHPPKTNRPMPGGGQKDRALAVRPRHCWVVDYPDRGDRWPGILMEWRREESGWRGLAVVAVPGALGTILWVPSANLRPA